MLCASQTEQDGTVAICGPNEASVQAAAAKIRGLVSEVEVGVVYRFAWLAFTCCEQTSAALVRDWIAGRNSR